VTAKVIASEVSGSIDAPVSKSAMQRACALALLNNGTTLLYHPGISNDDKAAIEIIQALGASVEEDPGGYLIIKSDGKIEPPSTIHCGESGLSLRMFTPLISLSSNEVKINGEGTLLKRPLGFFDEVLPSLNVKVVTNNGLLPMSVQGPLLPADIIIDGSQSSQYLTGLLFAFAKSTKQDVTIQVKDLASKPYIELSVEMLSHFGYKVVHKDFKSFDISATEPTQKNIEYHAESDWSSSSFLFVAGAIAGSITVKGLRMISVQADRAILKVLTDCGVTVNAGENSISVDRAKKLTAFSFDATDCPDLFPPLAVLAAYCDGTSVITGTDRLKSKESNRADSLYDVLTKMGIKLFIKNNTMTIAGGTVKGVQVDSHHDHRITMACTVAALGAEGEMVIHGSEAVNKSYPQFFDHLKQLGASISIL
jgi:3-phosphoshikimate 1-carboxyvinyltransferase